MSNQKINCSICGESIESTFSFCPSCGVSIKKEDNKTNLKEVLSSSHSETKKGKKKSNLGNDKNNLENPIVEKKISLIKLLYIIIGLVVIGFVILLSTGLFDKVKSTTSSNNLENIQDFHSGVDLSSLQRINVLEEKTKNDPNDHASLIELAHLLNDSGFKEKAIEKYKIYLKVHPEDADVLVDMGVCYYEMTKYEEALKWMKEALKFQPKHQIAHLNIGIVSLSSGNHDEAIEWWKKAAEIEPNNNVGKRAQELINSH